MRHSLAVPFDSVCPTADGSDTTHSDASVASLGEAAGATAASAAPSSTSFLRGSAGYLLAGQAWSRRRTPDAQVLVSITSAFPARPSPRRGPLGRPIAHLLCATAILLITAGRGAAQTTGTTAPTDAPGRPAGSYQLSGLENVSLYSGNLNFRLPLLSVGGRGGTGTVITLTVDNPRWKTQRWTQRAETEGGGGEVCTECRDGNYWIDGQIIVQDNGLPFTDSNNSQGSSYVEVRPDTLLGAQPGYGPGVLKGIQAWNRGAGLNRRGYSLTRLTFTAPDGTEYEFVDRDTYGQPKPVVTGGFSRGTVFVSTDGRAATFISDEVVRDIEHRFAIEVDLPSRAIYPSGYLLLADGTRYRVVGGLVRWLRDRDGNAVSFDYDPTGRVTLITDPLGRRVTITYATAETPYDQLNFKGFGGEARAIRVHRARLENAFRPGAGYALKTYAELFPETDTGGSITPHNPDNVATAVELPNGARYDLRYNPHGELERVELPTGGAYEYRYGSGRVSTDRRVSQRLVFSDKHDTVPESRHVYHAAYPLGPSEPQVTTVTASQQDGGGAQLAFSKHSFYGVEGSYSFGFYPSWKEGREFRTETYAGDGVTPLKRVEQVWRQRAPVAWYTQSQERAPACDPRMVETTTTLEPEGANLTAKTTSIDPQTGAAGFDQFNNQTDAYEYDYGAPGSGQPGALRRHTHTDYVTVNNGLDYTSHDGPHLRALVRAEFVYAVNADTGQETLAAHSETRYDEAAYPLLPCDVGNNVPCSAATGWVDPDTAARGNATTERKWLDAENAERGVLDPGDTWVETHAQHDGLGRVRRAWDARGKLSQVIYTDADGTNSLQTFAFATLALSPDPDGSGPLAPLVSGTKYDQASGLAVSSTDPNGQTTAYSYVDDQGGLDPLDRLHRVTRPDGGRTRFEYDDAAGQLSLRTLVDIDAGRVAETKQYFDGLGRPVRSFSWENQDASKPWLTADTQYDAQGRVRRRSSQYRSAGPGSAVNPSGRWTTTGYDALGRVTSVTAPDGARVLTAYDGAHAMVTDQAGKRRVRRTDALGRLTDVWEVTAGDASAVTLDFGGATYAGYLTSYKYDALDNLRKVEQGSQVRFFAYDSIGRLVRSRNPEQGVMATDDDFPALLDSTSGTSNGEWSLGYKYDPAGNLWKRKDARGVRAEYGYDALNRNTSINFSDSTPDVTRSYDGAVLGKGRLWRSEAAGVSRTTLSEYDQVGRPKGRQQQFWTGAAWGATFSVSRLHDLAGNVTSQTYPSGRAVTYSYDEAGRLGDRGGQPAFAGTLGDGVQRTYASEVRYQELGGMEQERFGTQTPVYNKRFYNVRGQLAELRVGTTGLLAADPGFWNRGAILNVYSAEPAGGWTASGPDNNGNLRKQMIFVPNDDQISGSWQTNFFYEYDALNRLDYVRESQGGQNLWVQDYDYDRWGNRTVNQQNTKVDAPDPAYAIPEPQYDRGDLRHTNRLYAPGDTAQPDPQQRKMRYDAAGHLTQEPCHNNLTPCAREFDAEGRMTAAQYLNGQVLTARFAYDADGLRVTRSGGWEGQVRQVFGFDGELLAEYTPQAPASSPRKEYGYRDGELLVTAEAPHAAGRANFALSATGAAANASSALDSNRAAAGAVDGDRAGHNWGVGGGWHDATNNSYPDWLEVDFGSAKTIDEVNVFSVQDTYWSPQEPSEAAAFAQYGLVDFDVQYWNGSGWAAVPGGQVRGNSLVWRKLKFAPVTTQKVRLLVHAAQAGYSRVAEFEAWGPSGPPPPRLNIAASANGATANASTTLDAGRAASGVVNGDRAGRNWGNGGGWHDATNNAFPDWLEVTFNGARAVDEVSVFSVQDNFLSPSEPTEAMTFSLYGVTAFDVQWWDGSAWQTAASVTGNNKVWRRVTFAPVTTTKIRVRVAGAQAGYSRVAEVEAYGGGAAEADVRWLVADHLGSPRMVFDRTGSLAGMSRFDYLPFGEELGAEVAGRTTQQGYGRSGVVRQKFTGHERDQEIGLDFMRARYYSSVQGRFASPDEFTGGPDDLYNFASDAAANPTFYADLTLPQSLNKYQYCFNNPLAFVDADGHQSRRARSTPRKTSPTRIVTRKTYEARGSTAEQAAEYANRYNPRGEGFAGYTTPEYDVTGPRMTTRPNKDGSFTSTITAATVNVIVTIEVLTPTWVEYGQAPASHRRAWDDAMTSLREHEEGHVCIFEQTAYNIQRGLKGMTFKGTGATERQAAEAAKKKFKKEVDRLKDEGKKRSGVYDEKTNHGRLP